MRICLPISASPNSGHQFYPWFGKIPSSTEQLKPVSHTAESVRLEPMLRAEKPPRGGVYAATKSSPCSPQLEQGFAKAMKVQRSQK